MTDSDVVPRETERPPAGTIEQRVEQLEDEFDRLGALRLSELRGEVDALSARFLKYELIQALTVDSLEFLVKRVRRDDETDADRERLIQRFDDFKAQWELMVKP